jgi:hypothetical protein
MEILLSVMLHSYLDTDLWKIFTELSYFYRQLCAKQVSKMMIQKFEKEILILVCKMKKVFLSGWFNAMQYFLVHLSWEGKVGGLLYSQERELEKLRATVCNKAMVEGCIAETFTCKEIMNFSSMYFSRNNDMNAHTPQYHTEEVVLLSELKIFQWNGNGVGATTTIPCFTYIRIWKKSYHILRCLTRYIANEVNSLH